MRRSGSRQELYRHINSPCSRIDDVVEPLVNAVSFVLICEDMLDVISLEFRQHVGGVEHGGQHGAAVEADVVWCSKGWI